MGTIVSKKFWVGQHYPGMSVSAQASLSLMLRTAPYPGYWGQAPGRLINRSVEKKGPPGNITRRTC